MVKNLSAMQEMQEMHVQCMFNAGDAGSITGSGRYITWTRAGQPTPIFLPEESHGKGSLVGYNHRVTKSQT